jgi:hypothetical protein
MVEAGGRGIVRAFSLLCTLRCTAQRFEWMRERGGSDGILYLR